LELLEQDAWGRKVHEIIGRVVLPAGQESALLLPLCKEAFDDSTPLITAQSTPIHRLALYLIALVRSDPLHTLLAHARIQWIAVVDAITNKGLRLNLTDTFVDDVDRGSIVGLNGVVRVNGSRTIVAGKISARRRRSRVRLDLGRAPRAGTGALGFTQTSVSARVKAGTTEVWARQLTPRSERRSVLVLF
jgi:hypothetical protein